MEKIVYLLGAGFSAPLGLPVMSNFLVKSKDIYFENPEKYKHFKEVFDKVNEMSIGKSYYNIDLFNIEEILSILDMGDQLEGKKKLKKSFVTYIKDVIEHYTPIIAYNPNLSPPSNWEDNLLHDNKWNGYGYFVGNLFNLSANKKVVVEEDRMNRGALLFERNNNANACYSIISLNYDLILESICDCINKNNETFINTRFNASTDFKFKKPENNEQENWATPTIAKLHGSVDSGVIIPPTWSKGIHKDINSAWRKAYQILVEANYIRFIGYSLPTSDAYIKYLLKSAVQKAPHLKSIDVICLDPDGSVKNRFDEFIHFKNYRFINANVSDYLDYSCKVHKDNIRDKHLSGKILAFNKLNEAHNKFCSSDYVAPK